MGYLTFNKSELVNLQYSLHKEILSTNRAGAYMSTTIVCCNTRKYHGLLVCPIQEFDGESYVLLSSLDETVIQHEQTFNLGIHQYPNGVYEPRGHKYIVDFEFEPTPTLVYRVGGVILKKELLMIHNSDQLLIRYTLVDAHSPTTLRLRPFMAYRNRHQLSKANLFVNTDHDVVEDGIAARMYSGFPVLNLQLDKKNKFISNPDWYYNIEYSEEKARGYDYQEDLYTPGYFEVPIKKGESIIVSASLKEEKTKKLSAFFDKELSLRPPKDSFLNCLKNSATQFIVQQGKNTEILAGFPWFGRWGRDTFIALPGLTLAANYDLAACKGVLDTMSREVSNGLFPNIGKDDNAAYNSVDAPMWYFWAIQKYAEAIKDKTVVWKDYGKKMKQVLEAFRNGINSHIRMHDNGLIWAGQEGKALTWMDAVVDGVPVTPRAGYAVEINALWYNAIKYTLELAEENGDKKFVKEWADLPSKIEENFTPLFWNDELGYLADYVDEMGQNTDLRPNQIIAASLPYSPIDDEKKSTLIYKLKDDLLTVKGLRTLSPSHPDYKGFYSGDQPTRDRAYHQGTVWVWQLGHYVEACFRLHGKAYLTRAKEIVSAFEEDMTDYGICSIAEVYDGNPPHHPGGSISQAWSVSEILRIIQMIEQNEKK
ncbi:amylo-alpha-1,6-glucosidase [Dysgonomonas macrotermitis]|uniref:Glycogen debranching enzyme, putative n=1 Tax=Dysgonomonas macrotermitis TaxID=1346286 RepID=A0A1M5B1L1_9BACT|nr:amylo-alpha-1,6-glucosidase [Dysgonomonas macrotermitis]SHF36394.1 glycogen debranching enzyme, putative [Dysgonomonas macrotermitis]